MQNIRTSQNLNHVSYKTTQLVSFLKNFVNLNTDLRQKSIKFALNLNNLDFI